jgi:chromosome segregation ATPase
MKVSESLLLQQNNSYSTQLREYEHKVHLLQQDYHDQLAESQEAIEFISKQKNEIEILKNERKESNTSQQLLQKELKLLSLQYEKLEQAFVDSIGKIMNHQILILDEREEDDGCRSCSDDGDNECNNSGKRTMKRLTSR